MTSKYKELQKALKDTCDTLNNGRNSLWYRRTLEQSILELNTVVEALIHINYQLLGHLDETTSSTD